MHKNIIARLLNGHIYKTRILLVAVVAPVCKALLKSSFTALAKSEMASPPTILPTSCTFTFIGTIVVLDTEPEPFSWSSCSDKLTITLKVQSGGTENREAILNEWRGQCRTRVQKPHNPMREPRYIWICTKLESWQTAAKPARNYCSSREW